MFSTLAAAPGLPSPEAAFAALAAFLGVSIAWAWVLYARLRPVLPRTGSMRFLDHLDELRVRLLRVAGILAYWLVVFTAFRFRPVALGPMTVVEPVLDVFDNAAARVYAALAANVVPPGVQLVVTQPLEAVGAQIQVAFLLAFVVGLPAILFELWAFLGPGLQARERRLLARVLPAAVGLFLAGAAFAYGLVVPLLLRVFYAFADPLGAVAFLSVGSLVGMVVLFAFLFGLAFELPLVLALLVTLRVTSPRLYLEYGRHATLLLFVVAALVTDPTLVSFLIVGGVLCGLYWGGVLLSFAVRPPRLPLRTAARA